MKIAIAAPVFLLFLCGASMAQQPRGEVMARAYRCAAQPATRVWLDCYYGAAQPQRAALGLPPAPAEQTRLADVPPGTGVPQDQTARDAVLNAAGRCGGGERAWLDCYYAASNPVRTTLGLAPMSGPPPVAMAPQPMIATAKPPPPPRAMRNDPGFIGRMMGMSSFKLVAHMTDYRFEGNGLFVVTLDNGQVWKQNEGESDRAHWRKSPSQYVVTITGGALGSYNLAVENTTGHFKVRRAT